MPSRARLRAPAAGESERLSRGRASDEAQEPNARAALVGARKQLGQVLAGVPGNGRENRSQAGGALQGEAMKKHAVERLAIETVVPAAVGVGLVGYVLYRLARGAARIAYQAFVDFVSG